MNIMLYIIISHMAKNYDKTFFKNIGYLKISIIFFFSAAGARK